MPARAINIGVINLGRITYNASLHLQNQIASNIKLKNGKWTDGVMLLLEYPSLYTIGIRTKGYTKEDEENLRKLGAEFYRTDRGGLITYHGPGQLVVYPILNLKCWQRPHSVRWYVENLEESIIELCKNLNITSNRYHPYPGIWVGEKKLCAVGVHASRHVTTHGIALNCNTELKWFKHIIPCGIEGKGVTSISELLKRDVYINDIIEPYLQAFETIFQCKLHWTDLCEIDKRFVVN